MTFLIANITHLEEGGFLHVLALACHSQSMRAFTNQCKYVEVDSFGMALERGKVGNSGGHTCAGSFASFKLCFSTLCFSCCCC